MKTSRRRETGSALLLSVIISFVVIGAAGAYLGLTIMRSNQTEAARSSAQALYVAESAAADFIFRLNTAGSTTAPVSTESVVVGKDKLFLGGGYKITGSKYKGSDSYTLIEVEGQVGSQRRYIEVILSKDPGGVFWNAVFAGNSSGSDDYVLSFGSDANNKDIIKGDVYSGGKVDQNGDAQILPVDGSSSGSVAQVMYASDDIDGYDNSGTTQATKPNFVHGSQPNLDIAAMSYDAKAEAYKTWLQNGTESSEFSKDFVNVTAILEQNGKNGQMVQNGASGDQGLGTARSLAGTPGETEKMLGHMFRENPMDGSQERVYTYGKTNTAKTDYFIEDITRPAAAGSPGGDWLGGSKTGGQRINVQKEDNEKAYFFDGNLWASNSPTFTFHFENNTGGDMRMTWIVKGNVFLTDNLLYDRNSPGQNDALALIAIEDPKYPNYNPEEFKSGGKGLRASSSRRTPP
jgi:hypothetical protein